MRHPRLPRLDLGLLPLAFRAPRWSRVVPLGALGSASLLSTFDPTPSEPSR